MKQIYPIPVLLCFKHHKLLLIGLFLLLTMRGILAQDSLNKISFSFRNQPAISCLKDLELRYGLQFSFNATALEEIKITASVNDFPLEKALEKLLAQSPFQHQFFPPQTVLILEREEEPTRTICGYLRDFNDKSPIGFANIYLPAIEKGTSSDQNGFFSLEVINRRETTVELSYLGYQNHQLPLSTFPDDKCITTFLVVDTNQMQEVLVIDKAIRLLNTAEEGAGYEMKPNQLNALPGWGMPDVLRTVQLLPGVSAEDELATQLSIRGGSPDQNLLLWEGIPVYHTGHFFGLQSIFNPSIVDRVEVHRGSFSARYGGRVSGLLNIETALHPEDSLEIKAGANLLSFNASVQAPIRSINSSILFSARRSFTDIWPNATYRNLFNQVAGGGRIATDQMNEVIVEDLATTSPTFFFDDSYLKWQSQIGRRTLVQLSAYSANDELQYELASKIQFFFRLFNAVEQSNKGGSLKLAHNWKNGTKTSVEINSSTYDNQFVANSSLDANDLDQFSSRLNNSLQDETFRLEHEVHPHPDLSYRIGLQTSDYTNDLFYEERRFDSLAVNTGFRQQNELLALYFDGDYRVSEKVNFDLGLRTTAHQGKLFWEPRFHMDAILSQSIRFNLGIAGNHQFLFQTEVPNDLKLAERQWLLTVDQLNFPIRSLQASTGVQYNRGPTLIELEFYQKWLDNLTTVNVFIPEGFELDFSIGESRSRGIDFLFKHKWPNLQLWLAYSLASAQYIFPTINTGDNFPTALDQRHNLRIAPIFSLGDFDLAFIFQLRSGSPTTTAIGIKRLPSPNENPRYGPIYGPLNGNRLPTYQRLDFSAAYNWGNAKSRGKLGFSIFNMLNQRNIGNVRYDIFRPEDDPLAVPELIRIEQFFLRFTPNFFLEFTW